MMMTPKQTELASKLEQAFALYGFAQPNVAKLKDYIGTTLKTLYKYFPSKEDMIIGALNYRHSRYISFLETGCPPSRNEALKHIFERLSLWLNTYAPRGCMSLQALASYPGNQEIETAVNEHKHDVLLWLNQKLKDEALAQTAFLLHEGMSSAWPVLGEDALSAATAAVDTLLD
ncbi:TetR/AcrR family transcriptional regulator [Alteromonas sp. V450]|uniref:TetR/AcrR family transcriptional regulator n=1 Tax=Alteromonas sp. V450 TaxID=1912139 RepID=UPI000A4247E2|nr:TetR/AcrR family transcriptional regulator [Alteromonas sp. V450]